LTASKSADVGTAIAPVSTRGDSGEKAEKRAMGSEAMCRDAKRGFATAYVDSHLAGPFRSSPTPAEASTASPRFVAHRRKAPTGWHEGSGRCVLSSTSVTFTQAGKIGESNALDNCRNLATCVQTAMVSCFRYIMNAQDSQASASSFPSRTNH